MQLPEFLSRCKSPFSLKVLQPKHVVFWMITCSVQHGHSLLHALLMLISLGTWSRAAT